MAWSNRKVAYAVLSEAIDELTDSLRELRSIRKAVKGSACSVDLCHRDFEISVAEGLMNDFTMSHTINGQALDIIPGCVAAVANCETVLVFFSNDEDAVRYRLEWQGSSKLKKYAEY